MKVFDPQVALISNFEAYQHISDVRAQYKKWNEGKRREQQLRVPANLFHLQTEILDYLITKLSPLREQNEKQHYNDEVLDKLLSKLQEVNLHEKLFKGGTLCIFNIRRSSTATLNGIIESMETRFTEEEQNRIVEIVAEVLGHDEPEEEEEEEAAEGDDAGEEEGTENVN